MQFYNLDDKTGIAELFPLPCDIVITSGSQEGVILKFKTYYLKIYEDRESYYVEGYLYQDPKPTTIDTVSRHRMREFASMFRHDDYLSGYKLACIRNSESSWYD